MGVTPKFDLISKHNISFYCKIILGTYLPQRFSNCVRATSFLSFSRSENDYKNLKDLLA